MGVLNPNSTPYVHPNEPNLLNIHKAMEYRDGLPHLRVNLGSDNITVTGNVNIIDTISLTSSTLSALETVTVSNTSFAITNFPTTSTVYQGTTPWATTVTNWPALQLVNGTLYAIQSGTWNVGIVSLPEVEIKNDLNNPIPVTGNVTATVSDVITVIVDEDAGSNFAFNNHAVAVHRGWTMDDTMRPVVSVCVTDTGTTINDIIEIIEYEIGNNNANQSTIIYEWYEGPLTISGAAIPSWSSVGTKIQYRIYQDIYGSNTSNTFTVPAGTHLRHSGIIIGKNATDDEGPCALYGGATPNMLTLCMKRVDSGTKLDIWFAFTIKELA